MFNKITEGRFTCTCTKCTSQTVNMIISHVTSDNGWGEQETATKIKFKCSHCENEWSEKY